MVDVRAYAIEVAERGYAVIPAQVGVEKLADLNAAADRAIEALDRALAMGVKPAHTQLNQYYRAVRCFYCWDRACRELLEIDTVSAMADAVLGDARLWDMELLEARPMPRDADRGPFDWHRDFHHSTDDDGQSYLWVFVCLTDTTTDNGATWVLPGSHRNGKTGLGAVDETALEGRIQLTARAGDIVAINPVMLHAVGENRTSVSRRLALIALCRAGRLPLLNHRAIAARGIQFEASEGMRRLLYSDRWALEDTWDVLPEGWRPESRVATVKRVLRKCYRRGVAAPAYSRHFLQRLHGAIKGGL